MKTAPGTSENITCFYTDIKAIIEQKKQNAIKIVNATQISLQWEIGRYLVTKILNNEKPEHGARIVEDISHRLTREYGPGFNRTAVFRMIQFYREFPKSEIVATLSQQLTWSHFIELLPIEDELKRNFYAFMCQNENWSVRELRDRKNSLLYERTAISKKHV